MWTWILAASSTGNIISRQLQHRRTPVNLLICVGAILMIGLLWFAYSRLRNNQTKSGPAVHDANSLFHELCQVHRLVRGERILLQQAVQRLPSNQHCQVFVDPRILGRLSIANTPDADGYVKLARKLFGDNRA